MITSSDGLQYNSWSDYHLDQPNEPQGSSLSQPRTTSREPVDNPQEDQDMYERRKRHMEQDRSEVDRSHSVPLLAASTPNGIAIDHRVNTNMEYEGKVHDLTPFLKVHEDKEREPYYAAKEKGVDPKEAYEKAHALVANPAETSARNAYAIKEGLDPEEFGKAYNNHMQQQMKVAMEPTDVPRHPEAHTNDFEHHYIKKPTAQQKQDFQMKEGKDIEDQVLPKDKSSDSGNIKVALSDKKWGDLPENEQKDLEQNSYKAFEGSGFNDPKELEDLVHRHGAIEVDPRNGIVKKLLERNPEGIEKIPYKDNPDRTIFLRSSQPLTSSLKGMTHLAVDMEDSPGYVIRHGGMDDTSLGMGFGARTTEGPMVQPKSANDNAAVTPLQKLDAAGKNLANIRFKDHPNEKEYDANVMSVHKNLKEKEKDFSKEITEGIDSGKYPDILGKKINSLLNKIQEEYKLSDEQMKYLTSLAKQKNVAERRSKIKLVEPPIESRPAADQLRDWFNP